MLEEPDRPPVQALFAQLASDTSAFAKAEITWLREQAGERWSYALPAIVALGIGVAILFAVMIAVPLGLMWAIAPMTGPFWAILIVVLGGLLTALVLMKWSSGRIKAAIKRPEDRK